MFYLVPVNLFYAKDLYIDLFSLFIILFLLFHAIRFYKINKSQKKYLLLISSFSLLSLSFIAKVLSHFLIYSTADVTRHLGIISFTYRTIYSSSLLVFWGLLFYRLFSVFALYLFYLIYVGKINVGDHSFIIFLLMLVIYLGQAEFYIYHLTFIVLLLLIIISLLSPFGSKKSVMTKFLASGFSVLLLSQLVFIFMSYHSLLYFIGELIQIIGYLLILFGFILVLRGGNVEKKR